MNFALSIGSHPLTLFYNHCKTFIYIDFLLRVKWLIVLSEILRQKGGLCASDTS